MNDHIETERLVLRRITAADVPALFAIMRDAETMRYWSTLPHATPDVTARFVDETVAAVAAGTADDFAITQNGAVIGKAGLWQVCELGVLLARSHWGRGLAREALRAVIDRAFANGVAQIKADVDPRNQASLRLLGQLGFTKTGEAQATFQLGEEWVDSVYLSLSATDRYGT